METRLNIAKEILAALITEPQWLTETYAESGELMGGGALGTGNRSGMFLVITEDLPEETMQVERMAIAALRITDALIAKEIETRTPTFLGGVKPQWPGVGHTEPPEPSFPEPGPDDDDAPTFPTGLFPA